MRSRSVAPGQRAANGRSKARNGNGEVKPRQRLSYDDRREQIVAAARKVFVARGLGGGRTREIADSIGVTEALLYHYFSSKEELFEAAILEPLQALGEQLGDYANRQVFADSDLEARREESIRFHQKGLTVMLEVIPLLGVALFSDQKQGGRFYREQLAPLTDRFAAGLATTLEGWRHHDVDPELLARMILGTYGWIALDSGFRRSKVDVPATAEKLTDMFVRVMSGSSPVAAAAGPPAKPAPRRRAPRTA
jgi:AcrR family transcriptional regulator